MPTSRRRQLSDRLADSSLMRNVIGPKVLEPMSEWYENSREDAPEPPDPAGSSAPTQADDSRDPQPMGSETLAAARAAEAFLAGPDAGDSPESEASASTNDDRQEVAVGGPATIDERRSGPAVGPKDVALDVKVRIKEHNLGVVAAGIAFWSLLAIPAMLTAILSIYGMFAEPDQVEKQIEDNLSSLPEDARSIITGQLESVAGASGGGLAIGAAIGIVLALWTSSGAVAKVIATLNTIWGVSEDRRFLQLRGMALAITFGAIAFIAGAAFILAVLPAVLSEVGLADLGRWFLNVGRFPALLLFMATGLSVLYWIGPNRAGRYRPLTPGAVVATLLWVLVSGIFSAYTASFASYNETYGSLGAVVILLMWLFLTAFMVLLGAEIDAAREQPADAE